MNNNITLIKDYFGLTTKEAKNYIKNGENIDAIITNIKAFNKDQAKKCFLED